MKRKAEEEASSAARWDFVAAANWLHKKRKHTSYCDSTSTLLPPQSEEHRGKHTLVLDMDRTLIFSRTNNVVLKFGGKSASLPVSRIAKRPGVDEFLQQMCKVYEIVVFTCGIKQYADTILDKLDPEGKLISHRLYRDSCTVLEGKRTKDLLRLGRDMKKVVILDDKRKSFRLNPGNGIKIRAFKHESDHSYGELEKLTSYLLHLAKAEDVRVVLQEQPPEL